MLQGIKHRIRDGISRTPMLRNLRDRIKARIARIAWEGRPREPLHPSIIPELAEIRSALRQAELDRAHLEDRLAELRGRFDWLCTEYPDARHETRRALSGVEWLYPLVQKHERAVDAILEMKPEFTGPLTTRLLNEPAIASLIYPIERNADGYIVERKDPAVRIAPDGLPLPPAKLSEGYGLRPDYSIDADEYIKGGREQVRRMLEALAREGFDPSDRDRFPRGARVLDFGCSSGRMLRHLRDIAETGEAWGVDIGGPTIAWAQIHLAPPFRFATTTSAPPLPFPTGTFDMIYAGSVFTHIAELTEAWLLELRRITRPGGMLYLTFFDDHSIEEVRDQNKWPGNKAWEFIEAFDRETGVLSRDYAYFVYKSSPKNTRIAYRSEYLREKLGTLFEVRRVARCAYGWQTAYILGRPADDRAAADQQNTEITVTAGRGEPARAGGQPQ